MWTLVSLSLALLTNFCIPEIPENKKLINSNYTKNKTISGFPYEYYKGEMLTCETVQFRIQVIYIFSVICIKTTFSNNSKTWLIK